ncbi:MAG TPA: hypothetical protein VIZ22_11655 [Candidatus Limnocylindrales bacterium]
MRSPRSRLAVVALVTGVVLTLAACGDATRPPATVIASLPAPTSDAPASPTPAAPGEPSPTAVPGGQTIDPEPPPTQRPTTTKTDWGVILDAVPDDFPRYPGAAGIDSPDEPVSEALETADGVEEVATWYREALEAAGYMTIDLSAPLEDGSRVLDSQTDIPECRVQTTFRPEGEATMITVLFAAGCVALGG